LKVLSFRLLLKYESQRMPTAVAKAAMMLKEARMMVEVLMDLAAENLSSLKNICCVVWFVAVWKTPVLDLLLLLKPPWVIHLLSSRDSSHPTPPATSPANGDIWVVGSACGRRLAMAKKP